MKTPIMKEADLAARVVAWLESQQFEIFHEVQPNGRGGVRADIVAVRAGVIRVIETKMVLGLEVMAQAAHWLQSANYVLIAVPEAKSSAGRSMGFKCCAHLGLGVLVVKSLWPIDEGRIQAVRQEVEPEYRQHIHSEIRDALRDEHKTHAKAGTNRGGHVTSFKLTCEAIARVAEEKPGMALRGALALIEHHYASLNGAVANLTKMHEKGVVLGFELRDTSGVVTVHPTTKTQTEESGAA